MRTIFVFLMIFFLSACQIEFTNGNRCSSATDHTSGYRVDVFQQTSNFGNLTENGYESRSGRFVRHYECGPASYRRVFSNQGVSELFEFFRHDARSHSINGMTDIEFKDSDIGQRIFKTNQLNSELVRDEGERDNGKLYRRIWPQEQSIGPITLTQVTVSNERAPDISDSIFAVAETKTKEKRKVFDENDQLYTCYWLEGEEVIETLSHCSGASEEAIDMNVFGIAVDLMSYIDSFNANLDVSYSTDPDWYRREMKIR